MPPSELYLDHAATTPLDPEVADRVAQVQADVFGNPSSPHAPGRRARQLLDEAREQILADLGCSTAQLVFTSGATEANHLAVLGLLPAEPPPDRPLRLATSSRDHESLRLAAAATQHKAEVNSLPLAATGQLDQAAVTDWLRLNPEAGSQPTTTLLLATTLVCGQTGAIEDMTSLRGLLAQWAPQCLLHTDATQAVGRLPIDFYGLGVTSLCFAPHKFGGPRGIGCLVLRPGLDLKPLLHGAQQFQLRGGTEPVSLVAGCQLAVSLAVARQQAEAARLDTLRQRFELQLASCGRYAGIEPVVIAAAGPRSPHISTVAFPGIDRQAFVMAADLTGLAVATGTACASGSSEPAPALTAMGIERRLVQGAVRFSFGRSTTISDIDEAIARISQLLQSSQPAA
ncbi:MAG: cysteine desulfurase [Planctomycetia bacterium]|jgi:cysteine desulfurase|nr:cysteine desulfurase [Planctomycetia bacterium]